MRIGDFEIHEPPPELTSTSALAMLSPWVDVGKVGSLVLTALETKLGAAELGKLARPGDFYDFTRYRPMMYQAEGQRRVKIPNTEILFAAPGKGKDMVFIHCLEPHAHGETFVESMLHVLQRFGVRRHCLIGGMYDSVPHTRPLLVSGGSNNPACEAALRQLGIKRSNYQGPTTITVLLTEQAAVLGIETLTLLVRLPSYAQLEEDYTGACTVLRIVNELFGLAVDTGELKKLGEEQYKKLDAAVETNPQAKEMVKALESSYDAETRKEPADPSHKLSPEVERFLRDMSKRFGTN
ncbi:MAG: PAC2 family protein [Chloroflexi bacterium]|nr:PAC2 family protein [Chloroflexota bacterium]